MRRRRAAAVFAASLLAHAGLIALWVAGRPRELFVEPLAMNVSLVAPPRARRVEPEHPPRPLAPAAAPSPARREPAPPQVPPPPSEAPPPPRLLSDEELLAGRRTDLGQLRAAEDRGQRLYGRLRDCKPMSEHSDRKAPPCRVGGPDDAASRVLADGGAAAAGFAFEGRRKMVIHDYVEKPPPPGVADAREYPSLRCTFLHRHC